MKPQFGQREDLRAMQRAVRDGVSVSEARRRLDADFTRSIWPGSVPEARQEPVATPKRGSRALIAFIGLSVLFWIMVIVAAARVSGALAVVGWIAFAIGGGLAGWSIVRDVLTAIRWWRS